MTMDRAARLRRYLLGELGEEEQDRVEVELLSDGRTIVELEEAEDSLIEDYLAGALPPVERTRFEQYFLASPEHARSLEAARWLRARFADAREAAVVRRGHVGFMLAVAAAVLVAVGGLWLSQKPRTVARGEATPTSAPPRPAATEAAPVVRMATLTLSPGRVMSTRASPARIRIERETTHLRLELLVEDPRLDRARLSIADPQGRNLWQAGSLRPRSVPGGAVLTVDIPIEQLPAAPSYVATITPEPAGTARGTYYFELQRD